MWSGVVLTRGAEGRSVVYYVAIEAVRQSFGLNRQELLERREWLKKRDATLVRHLLRLLQIFRSLQLTRHLAHCCLLNL
jgi:hypothetical protein